MFIGRSEIGISKMGFSKAVCVVSKSSSVCLFGIRICKLERILLFLEVYQNKFVINLGYQGLVLCQSS